MHLIKYTVADGAPLSRSRHRARRGLRHFKLGQGANCYLKVLHPDRHVSKTTQVQCIQNDHQYTGLQNQTVT